MVNRRCEMAYYRLNKNGEELCGDHVEIVNDTPNLQVLVLADGLGSGVKANILSTLTSKMLATMLSQNLNLDEAVDTVTGTLPVDKKLNIAYSTFTTFRIVNHEYVEISRFDSPKVLMLRNGKHVPFKEYSRVINGKTVYQSRIHLQENDCFLAFSDGVIQAGPGPALNNDWLWPDVARYMEDIYDPSLGGRSLAYLLVDRCKQLYKHAAADDTTVAALSIRPKVQVNVLYGPPLDPLDDALVVSNFLQKPGKHVVCGGTSAHIVARCLEQEVVPGEYNEKSNLPPISTIKGLDLVTEGALTVHACSAYLENALTSNSQFFDWGFKTDGASQLARIFIEDATDIHFTIGRAINVEHEELDPGLHFNAKLQQVQEMMELLKKLGKKVDVEYV